jgi:hypothetical protein
MYRYFVSQSSEFCRHNTLCCFSTSVYCCLFRYDSFRKLLDTAILENVKVKVKLFLCFLLTEHIMKAYWGNGGIAQLIL